MNRCNVCHKEGQLLRCTGCREVQYCSKSCQIKDWKSGHRRTCTKRKNELEEKAHKAMTELQTLLAGNFDLETLAADKQKALDTVERLQEKEKEKNANNRRRSGTQAKENNSPSPTPKVDTTISTPKASEKRDQIQAKKRKPFHWDFWVENLNHISCYQISLRPKQSQIPCIGSVSQFSQQLGIAISFDSGHAMSTVTIKHAQHEQEIFSQKLHGKINPQPKSFQVFDDHGSLNIQLQYEANLDQPYNTDTNPSILKESDATHLCCKYCHWKLILPNAQINRVVQMPSSNWDDIADYLICYSGQATIDFTTDSTNTAQKGSVLLDKSALLLHQADVGQAVCVLAVEAYGQKAPAQSAANTENDSAPPSSPFAAMADDLGTDATALIRGEREWCEAVGGGSICCSQCCSVLGFASLSSPETFRFLKHRLAISKERESGVSIARTMVHPVMECASFVANEMIRYAETKAIFTFVVERHVSGGSSNNNSNKKHQKQYLLLLKLLSWDSQFATSESVDDKIRFRNAAKIIFEEVVMDKTISEDSNSAAISSSSSDDPTTWIWGGVDLCCLPDSKTTNVKEQEEGKKGRGTDLPPKSTSSVRLLLEHDEWHDLRTSLQEGASLFPEEVVRATAIAKLGKRSIPVASDENGLSPVGLSLICL